MIAPITPISPVVQAERHFWATHDRAVLHARHCRRCQADRECANGRDLEAAAQTAAFRLDLAKDRARASANRTVGK